MPAMLSVVAWRCCLWIGCSTACVEGSQGGSSCAGGSIPPKHPPLLLWLWRCAAWLHLQCQAWTPGWRLHQQPCKVRAHAHTYTLCRVSGGTAPAPGCPTTSLCGWGEAALLLFDLHPSTDGDCSLGEASWLGPGLLACSYQWFSREERISKRNLTTGE